jgi:protein-S-isoprenylcysteine O-methyltransferase Ste14
MEIFDKLFIGIILILFLSAFMAKNIITAKHTGAAIKGKSIKVNLLIFSTTMLYIVTCLNIFFNFKFLLKIEILDMFILKITGFFLVSIAFILGITSLITMKDSWRVGVRNEQKTELVSDGIFKFSRNPYFLSYIILYLGVFLVFPGLVYLLFYIIMVIIINLMINDEEEYLTGLHGETYLNYKKSVGRYFTIR